MASGYSSGGTDFDDLFDPYVQGSKSAATGMLSGGSDLNQRYAPISYGTKRADVGYSSNGSDVSNLWAAKGTAVYSLPFDGVTYLSALSAPSTAQGSTLASVQVSIDAAGTWSITFVGNGSGTPTSGTWLPSGTSASDWQVQFVGTPVFTNYTAGGSSSNGASDFSSCSTTRTYLLAATVPSKSAQECDGSVTLTVNLKNASTGQSFTTTAIFKVQANGSA